MGSNRVDLQQDFASSAGGPVIHIVPEYDVRERDLNNENDGKESNAGNH